jgi:hypothetical protein
MFLVLPTFLSRLQGRENRWTHPWTSSSVEAGVAAGAACALSLGTIGDQGARSSASPATARRNQELCISSPHPNRNAPDFFFAMENPYLPTSIPNHERDTVGIGWIRGLGFAVPFLRWIEMERRGEAAAGRRKETEGGSHSRSPPSFGTSSSRWSSR